jgi:hypothetical protein
MAIAPFRSHASGTPELVLREGAQLTAKTASGQISIVAGKDLERAYQWDGCSLAANMSARSVRWFGSFGIYDPAGNFGTLRSLLPWFLGCKGVSRTVVQEGQIHFEKKESAEQWISRYARTTPTVWSNDGLVVQWAIKSSRDQISVDVWQICISGHRPIMLSGAQDQAIVVSRKGDPNAARFECAPVGSDVYDQTQRAWQESWAEEDQRDQRR